MQNYVPEIHYHYLKYLKEVLSTQSPKIKQEKLKYSKAANLLTPAPSCELVNVIGVRPPLPVPALDDDLVLRGRAEAVEHKVARVCEGVGQGGRGPLVADGGDDVGPVVAVAVVGVGVVAVVVVVVVGVGLLLLGVGGAVGGGVVVTAVRGLNIKK